MTTFLAVCLRAAWSSLDASLRTHELQLCTVLATQISNWSLDLEQCPYDLDLEQATRLYDSGLENLAKDKFQSKQFPFLKEHTVFWLCFLFLR